MPASATPPPTQKPRPHVCTTCRRAYVRAEHLHRHLVTHERRKPFSCQSCGASFGRADVLQRHLRKCVEYARDGENQELSLPHVDVLPHTSSVTQQPQLRMVDDSSRHASCMFAESVELATLTAGHHESDISSITTQSSVVSCHPTIVPGLAETHVDISHQSQANSHAPTQQASRASFSTQPVHNVLDALNLRSQRPPQVASGGNFPSATGLTSPSPSSIADLSSFAATHQNLPSLMPVDFDNYVFLEDSLLPDLDYGSALHIPFLGESNQSHAQSQSMVDATELLLSRTRHVTPTPSPNDAIDGRFAYQVSGPQIRTVRCTVADAQRVKLAFEEARPLGGTAIVPEPSRSRVARYMNAYFEYFDPHTPIVHRPTFSIPLVPPALLLAMLAIGACYLSEHQFANMAYEAACRLLLRFETTLIEASDVDSNHSLWPIQAILLCVQYGAYAENPKYLRHAQRQIAVVCDLLRTVEGESRRLTLQGQLDWDQWLFLETHSRLACWTCVISAVILLHDPMAICLTAPQDSSHVPLPSNDGLWRATSATEWVANRTAQSYTSISFLDEVKKILSGQQVRTEFSSFALLALIGAITSHICSHERQNLGIFAGLEQEYVTKMERCLRSWEVLWRRHPLAERIPSKHGDPLMADCLSLLGSSYYHLYAGSELKILKQVASDPFSKLNPPPIRADPQLAKAIKYAAHSWLVRAKMGIIHLQRTAALEFGGHVLVTAYEGALILSWWLHEQNRQRHGLPLQSYRPDEHVAMDELFQEIFDEVSDQGVCCDIQKVHAGSPPLAFYRLLMHRWVWTYTSCMEQQLETFEARLVAPRS